MTKVHLRERLNIIKKTLLTLDKCHKQTLKFINENGIKVLKNPRDARENIMDSDDDSVYQKQLEMYTEDPPTRMKRTVIDGVKNMKIRKSKDIWNN